MSSQERAKEEWIEIAELEIQSNVGVSENERRTPQKLAVTLRFQITPPFGSLADEIAQTIDYGAVADEVRAVAASGSRLLIETLVAEIADGLMLRFPMASLEIELRKFILPNTRYVSVRTARSR
jgi:7,8-dihydroneopterin aldolase/epimerase/oxygenase